MTQPIAILNKWGRTAHSHDIRPLLGLKPGGHLPAAGMSARTIQGVQVYIKPEETKLLPRRRGAGLHRIRAICPICQLDVSAGRLVQHTKIHPVDADDAFGRERVDVVPSPL